MATDTPRRKVAGRLLTIRDVMDELRVADRRTALAQLERGSVAVMQIGRGLRVREEALRRMLDELEAESPGKRGYAKSRRHGAPAVVTSPRVTRTAKRRRNMTSPGGRARRGWVEKVEDGLYRRHKVSCPATEHRRPGTRCECPFAAHLPTARPGVTSLCKLEATTKAAAKLEKKRRQGAGRPKESRPDGTITLDKFFYDYYLPGSSLAKTTRRNYEGNYRREIEPHFGHRRLCDITAEPIELWVRNLERRAELNRAKTGKRTSGLATNNLTTLSSILSRAVKWRRLNANPTKGIEVRQPAPASPDEEEATGARKVLTRDQLQCAYAAARTMAATDEEADTTEAILRCGAELCLRVGEVRGLRLSDFDLEALTVKVQRQIQSGEIVNLKGKKARALPISQALRDLVRRIGDNHLTAGGSRDDFVFRGDKLPWLNQQKAAKTLDAVLRHANIFDSRGKPAITFHGLRHTGASFLLLAGVPLLKVSRFLGHSSVSVTERVYAHLLDKDELTPLAHVFDAFNRDQQGTPS